MSNIERQRIFTALVVAVLFVALSWVVPAIYYSVAPAENVVEVQNTEVTVESEGYNITTTYYSSDNWPIEFTAVLYEERENSSPVAVETWNDQTFLKSGTHTENFVLEPTTNISDGTYFFEFKLNIHTKFYVEREITHKTDVFVVNRTNSSFVSPPLFAKEVHT